jgi:hypothetical protein
MIRERLSTSLLAELFDREEDSYRLALREAKRIGGGPPSAALRAVAAHAGEALLELPPMARVRGVRLRSLGSLALDTFRRLGDVIVDQFIDHEQGYRRALASMRRGIDLVRLAHAAARDEGDDALTAWCHRWLLGREQLVADAANELEWFGRHPFYARLPTAALPSVS